MMPVTAHAPKLGLRCAFSVRAPTLQAHHAIPKARSLAVSYSSRTWHSGAVRAPQRGASHQVRASPEQAVAPVEPERKVDDRLPVTVITGFLGSGKTTLLNHLLTQNHGKRIAVIENEFGEIDIDSELVVSKEGVEGSRDSITQLSNGCLCCTVRDDLIQALNNLYERRHQLDHIVIETTGLANPAPIISSFFMDPTLPDKVRLDGVVTVVDALHVQRHLDSKVAENVVNEAVEQIAYADRIILNKVDLVSDPAALAALEARIRSINQVASMQRTNHAVVEVDYVLGVGGFELDTVEKQLAAAIPDPAPKAKHSHDHDHDHATCTDPTHDHSHDHDHEHDDHDHATCTDPTHDHSHDHHDHSHDEHAHGAAASSSGHSHGHDHEHDHDHDPATCTDPTHNHSHSPAAKKHDDKVNSVSLRLEGDMDLDRVNVMLGGLLQSRSEDLYRMKGILAVRGSDFRFVYQSVHSMFEGNPDREWRADEKRECKMVFIGRELERKVFEEAFTSCLAPPA